MAGDAPYVALRFHEELYTSLTLFIWAANSIAERCRKAKFAVSVPVVS